VNEHVAVENVLRGAEMFVWLGLRFFGLEPR
jgi:hypothetical protein